MKIKDFENIRKRYFPLYMSFLITAFIFMVAAVVVLVFLRLPQLTWWMFLIIALGSIVLVFGFIFLADHVERRYVKKYNMQFQEEIVRPILNEAFDTSLIDTSRPLDLKDIILIGKSHKFSILNELHTKNYSIYEISMLRDVRFRGFIIRRDLDEPVDDFIFMNYNYYYKPKIKSQRYMTGVEAFDTKYRLYSDTKDFTMSPKLAEKLSKKLQSFAQVGVIVENNTAYYVLGHRLRDRSQNFLNISLTEPMEDDLEMKIKIFVQKMQSICEYDFKS